MDCLSRIAIVEEDVFLKVLLYLNCQSISSLEQTCHSMRNFINHSGVWNRKFQDKQRALRRVEKEQRISLDTSTAQARRHSLLRLDQMEINLCQNNCSKMEKSFYEVVGFNGDREVLEAISGSSVLVNEDGLMVYDLHSGEKKTLEVEFEGENVVDEAIADDCLSILRSLDTSATAEFFMVDVYRISAGTWERVKRSPVMSNKTHGHCRRVWIVSDCTRLLMLGIKTGHTSSLLITSFDLHLEEDFEYLLEESVTVLELAAPVEPLAVRLAGQQLACLVSSTECKVWDLQAGDCLWSRRIITKTSIPAVRLTSLALSQPYLAVGASDGTCQLWDVVKDSLLRTIEHERGYGKNMGFRQLELAPNNKLMFSLTACGWLVAWDWTACLDLSKPASDLIVWKTNTKHETPIKKLVVEESRIVSIEEHQMTCEWDLRKFVVVRDFWQVQRKRKKKSSKKLKTKRKRL